MCTIFSPRILASIRLLRHRTHAIQAITGAITGANYSSGVCNIRNEFSVCGLGRLFGHPIDSYKNFFSLFRCSAKELERSEQSRISPDPDFVTSYNSWSQRSSVILTTWSAALQDTKLGFFPKFRKISLGGARESHNEEVDAPFWSSGSNSLPAFTISVLISGVALASCDENEYGNANKSQPLASRQATLQDLVSILGFWDWMLLIAAILLTLLHTIFNLAIPSTFSAVMNACREKLDLSAPIRSFVFLQGVVIVLDGGRHFILGVLGERIRQKLRIQLYESLLKQEVAYFDFNARGELLSLLGEDVHRIQQCLTDQILGFLTSIATLIYGGYKVVTISPKATVLVLLSFPILSVANLLAQGSCRKKALEVVAASRSNLSMATEVLNNPRTVQAFGAEGREAARYGESLQKQYTLECDYRAYTGLAHLAFSGINTLLSAGGLWYGGMLVAQGRTSLEDMMQFMQYSWKVGNAMGSLMTMYNEQHKSLAAATRVLRAIARRPRIERGVGLRPDSFTGQVELRDVTFSYPTRPETPVLRRMNLTLLPGTVTALVIRRKRPASGCAASSYM